MNVPLTVLSCYLMLGMVTTGFLWSQMALEIEMAIGLEDDDTQGPLRLVLTIVFVLAWPLVLYDVLKRS
jgi:hypothetical protein